MNVYKVYSLPILHPNLQKTFYVLLKDNAWHFHQMVIMPASFQSETLVDTCVDSMQHCILQRKCPGAFYTLFVNDAEWIKINCTCEVKPQTHNVVYNWNRNLLEVTEKVHIQCLQKTYHINVNTPFPLVFLPNACEDYNRNTYIPATVELTNNDPTLTLHKRFWSFNLTYMNITDHQFMQSLNVTKLTPEQLGWLAYKLPNYTMVDYDSLREQIQQIDEKYPYSKPTWLIILMTVLGTRMVGARSTIFFYFKYNNTPNHSKTSSIFWQKENMKETKAMPSGSPQ